MQSAQHAAYRTRMIVLHKTVVNDHLGQHLGAIRLHEEASRVFMNFGLDDDDSRKRGLKDFHSGLVNPRTRYGAGYVSDDYNSASFDASLLGHHRDLQLCREHHGVSP